MTNQTKRKSFIIHKDSLDILDKLSDEQAGKLFKAIKVYQKTNLIPQLDFTLDLVFSPFLNQFLRDEENYKVTCERRKEAGSKGGLAKASKSYQMQAKGSKCKQKVANLADSDSKNKSKNDNKNEIPVFINQNLFNDFIEMRNKIKKPLTDKAKELLIKDLIKFENIKTGNANISLENSIKNSWQGVFEPKQQNQTNENQSLNYFTKFANNLNKGGSSD